jgi:hypothetical protein
MYRQAAFALEEVLSMGVLAPLTLIKYADVLASIGGAAQLRTARAYYAKALQVCTCCIRHSCSRRAARSPASLVGPAHSVSVHLFSADIAAGLLCVG